MGEESCPQSHNQLQYNKLQNKGHQEEKNRTEMEEMRSELTVLQVRQVYAQTEYL